MPSHSERVRKNYWNEPAPVRVPSIVLSRDAAVALLGFVQYQYMAPETRFALDALENALEQTP